MQLRLLISWLWDGIISGYPGRPIVNHRSQNEWKEEAEVAAKESDVMTDVEVGGIGLLALKMEGDNEPRNVCSL